MVELAAIRAPLFVPANRPDRFAKAASSNADAIILDLEDAVARDDKAAARAALRDDFTAKPIIVRINAAGTPWHQDDLAAVRELGIAAVILPKAETPASIMATSGMLDGDVPVLPLIETASGLAAARAIAVLPGIERLIFGSIDFCADMGMQHRRDILMPARFELVLASRLAGLAPPIDGVTAQFDDDALTGEDAAHAAALGMGGKLCIHPRQVDAVLGAFLPSESEIAWARKVLQSADGAVAVDGEMIDEPVRLRARSILTRAGAE